MPITVMNVLSADESARCRSTAIMWMRSRIPKERGGLPGLRQQRPRSQGRTRACRKTSCARSVARRVPTLAIQHRVFAGIPEEIRHAAGDGVHWPVEAVIEHLSHGMQEKSQPAPRIVI